MRNLHCSAPRLLRQLLLLSLLMTAPVSAAPSVFLPGAFNGTWGASFPPFIPQILGPIRFNETSEADGIANMDRLGGAGTAAAQCPPLGEKREFYAGTYDYSNGGEFHSCTNGSSLSGVYRDFDGSDSGVIRITSTFPGPQPRWEGTFTSAGNPTGNIRGVYQGGGIATPLARGGAQQPLPPIPDGDPVLSAAPSGFVFRAQGNVVQRQRLEIVNTGGLELDWTAAADTLSGGSWLSVSEQSGSTTAARPSSFVNVMVDPSGLAPGDYYGSVTVRSTPGSDSERLTVVARVLAQGAFVPAEADPGGFLFVHSEPLGAPSQTLALTNGGTRPLTIQVESFFEAGVPEWFGFQPLANSMLSAGDSVTLELTVNSDFTPNVRSGELRITSSPADGGNEAAVTQRLDARLIVPLSADGAALSALTRQQGVCAATQLIPILRRPSLDFSVVAGFPLAIEAEIFDDCGVPLTAGSVTAEFSNGDPQLVMEPLRDGRWVASWAPLRESAAANITVRATDPQQAGIEGTLEVTGAIPETAATPILAAQPLSAISFARDQPVSLGSYVALFGTGLAGTLTQFENLPLPDTLEQTSVFLGGNSIPLLFVSAGQVNGIIPFDLPTGQHSMLIQRGATLSAPLRVTIAESQPALFSKNSTGGGQGLIERVSGDGSRSLAEPGTPARPGDVLVIYATGLGAVSGNVNVADASPSSPLAETLEPVTILVGEVAANVSFAGLTPGFAGLYQVNAALPAGAATGDAIPIVASVGETTSPAVTIAVSR